MNSCWQFVSALAAYNFVCSSSPEEDPYNLKGLERVLDDVCTYSCHLPHDVGVLSSDFPCCLILLLGTFALLYIACSPWFALSIGVQRCTNN